MMMRKAAAPARRISAAEAAGLVQSGMWVDYGAVLAQPDVFDAALAERRAELHGVKVRTCLSTRPRAVLEHDPDNQHFFMLSLHFSGYDRRKHDAGIVSYLPVNLGEIPDYYRRFLPPVDVAVFKTRPMDKDGNFNLGPANLWHRAVAERARLVIVEESEAVPLCKGVENHLHVSEVDFILRGDDHPLTELPNPPPTEVDRAVARLIMERIDDGDCLQIGIGGMPNAVCSLLAESSVKDLGIHTEMLTDGIIDLYKAGFLTGARKQIDRGKIVYSFGLGSKPLYDAVNDNPDFHCCPVDYTNLPQNIMQNHNMVSINNTTQIDLTGQAASESDGLRHISGTGGQLQFLRGAYASPGGRSFLCLSSTYDKKGDRRSRINLHLTHGNTVTTPRTDVMYIVTEYGSVCLKGLSVPERAKALIGIAHPDFREDLEREAYHHRLIPRGFF
ncbi:butyryl-CoA:acetate CoA-transferase [Tabrizicola sp. J26]|uniref:acetyl-CoA hydrolase/transferase family protein n=1 Tax=Alitabrizicola rongguiensis TaxID=2909234 RepID=UPI001F48E3D7|nr:acetyl-CoA hydrolase/transferase C-terminal domain-containing protein [Tabrizicola rongguiensis]MCF1709496.1 butyryl-CoA:acetate CoA-transferase [Tabrizicola rongguiensis]